MTEQLNLTALRGLIQKIRATKATLDRNDMDLIEAEYIKRWYDGYF